MSNISFYIVVTPPPTSHRIRRQILLRKGGTGATHNLALETKTYDVLVSTGSFNPPTCMHLDMFELARVALIFLGYVVIGGYMSPVNVVYQKKHRIQMCELACQSSPFIMVDPWELRWMRGKTRRDKIQNEYIRENLGSLKVMLLCGSDLLESFGIPGAWICDQVRMICRDYGVVCIRREGNDIDKIIAGDDILAIIKKGSSVTNWITDEVINYIDRHQLYRNNDELKS
ncbi:hypothetical protein AMTRI_Chr07g76240 [Amborella trichopoda]